MNNNLHFSSASSEWSTPLDLFDRLNKKYHFDLDAAASHENALCPFYHTSKGLWIKNGQVKAGDEDGLNGSWSSFRNPTWLNPPYGPGVDDWLEKAKIESEYGATAIVLLPARTDTRWFHSLIYNQENVSIEFLKGRLKFGGSSNAAPFPSMIIEFSPPQEKVEDE